MSCCSSGCDWPDAACGVGLNTACGYGVYAASGMGLKTPPTAACSSAYIYIIFSNLAVRTGPLNGGIAVIIFKIIGIYVAPRQGGSRASRSGV